MDVSMCAFRLGVWKSVCMGAPVLTEVVSPPASVWLSPFPAAPFHYPWPSLYGELPAGKSMSLSCLYTWDQDQGLVDGTWSLNADRLNEYV